MLQLRLSKMPQFNTHYCSIIFQLFSLEFAHCRRLSQVFIIYRMEEVLYVVIALLLDLVQVADNHLACKNAIPLK